MGGCFCAHLFHAHQQATLRMDEDFLHHSAHSEARMLLHVKGGNKGNSGMVNITWTGAAQ